MDEKLADILTQVAFHLNPRARESFVRLLPEICRPAIETAIRREEAPDSSALTPLEQRLLAQLAPPGEDESRGQERYGRDLDEGGDAEGEEDGGAEAVDEGEEVIGGPDTGEEPALPVLLAMLCAASEPEEAAVFLVRLPVHLQGQIVLKIAKGTPLNATRGLTDEEEGLVEALRQAVAPREQWGVDVACRILRAVPGTAQKRRALTAADELDHETVSILQNHLFVFEDLLRLGDPDLQTLLLQVDNETISQALMMTEARVRNRLLRNVSQRRQAMVREEEERYAHATLSEIEGAQMGMLYTARLLYEQGRITTYFGSVAKEKAPEWSPEEDEEEEEFAEPQEEGEGRERRKSGGSSAKWAVALLFLSLVGIGLLVKEVGFRSRSTSTPTAQSRKALGGKGGGVRVLVRGEGDVSADGTRENSGSLGLGESIRTPSGVKAMLELPRVGTVELEEQTEVERVPPAAEEGEEGGLYLRVGQVKTTVLEDGFPIRTPVVQVKGTPGTVFRTRVVLDGTTIVEVERGQVEVVSLVAEGRRWSLKAGDMGRFDRQGGEVSR